MSFHFIVFEKLYQAARIISDASTGGVARDHGGYWILCFSHYLGKCSPFEADIFDGLLILLDKGYKKGTIHTDNLEVVNALTMERMAGSRTTLLRRFNDL